MTEEPSPKMLWRAIKEKRFDDARALIESGVDTRISDKHDLTALDYAQLSGNIEFFKYVSRKNREKNVQTVMERFPALVENFLTLPDFQMKFKWRVYSWIPFISAFCPKDEWKMTKVGSKLRIDTGLANWSGFRFTKGSVSVFFDASCPDMLDSFLAVDNVSGEKVSVLREIIDSKDFDTDIDNLMNMDLLKGSIDVENIHRSCPKKLLRRKTKECVHDNFHATLFDFTNIKVKFKHYLCEDFGKDKKHLKPQYHEKTYSGKFWCSQDFPVQPYTLVPFLEALAPFKDTAKNIINLLGLFDVGTPIKGEVFVFPTVRVEFQFHDHNGNVDEYRNYVDRPEE
ncbi:hypothetical protein TRFO_10345 [Tritrichomonas foetus]|uniref:Ankyrin repeat domain-containing protein n=1 Tax=Tritrichomonas foetus TaxID=1144522 RepID=A0A1J4JDF2_9EUKA|nr:hypothetical protein TRFO_10345 [Tritrichomonas foetus]|eukprot:OHS95707.1 hypothetical protein TRFO_10345 [Tritrichomonas foetus]